MTEQLPLEKVTPDIVFEDVGIDYAGPLYIKHGYVCKLTVVKAYVYVFVSISVKATNLELVSDLTSLLPYADLSLDEVNPHSFIVIMVLIL